MKVALIGYGKMGCAIEKIASTSGIKIVARIDSNSSEAEWNKIAQSDVCIDFSHPDCLFSHLEKTKKFKKPIVVGTTGWYDQMDFVQAFIEKNDLSFIYAQNFSLGMHLFMDVVSKAAKLINSNLHYDVALSEIHHRHKLDAPSGTAHKLADILIENIDRKSNINISSMRVGSVPGTHTVIFNSDHDTITLTHEAHDRSMWALGAIDAAKWIQNKKGFFTMSDMMGNR